MTQVGTHQETIVPNDDAHSTRCYAQVQSRQTICTLRNLGSIVYASSPPCLDGVSGCRQAVRDFALMLLLLHPSQVRLGGARLGNASSLSFILLSLCCVLIHRVLLSLIIASDQGALPAPTHHTRHLDPDRQTPQHYHIDSLKHHTLCFFIHASTLKLLSCLASVLTWGA